LLASEGEGNSEGTARSGLALDLDRAAVDLDKSHARIVPQASLVPRLDNAQIIAPACCRRLAELLMIRLLCGVGMAYW